ncbi:MAG: hypothetical protein RDU76_03260 [Candidatus Edwardsbacteria bacterium]|nr:hypothetical protein [Candidatus Edwardsbacteria bacterium]
MNVLFLFCAAKMKRTKKKKARRYTAALKHHNGSLNLPNSLRSNNAKFLTAASFQRQR